MTHRRFAPILILVPLLFGCTAKPGPPPSRFEPGHAAMSRGNTLYARGCYQKAGQAFATAYEAYVLADASAFMAESLNNLGNAYRQLDQASDADLLYSDALRLARKSGSAGLVHTIQVNRAENRLDLGRIPEARADLEDVPANLPNAIRARARILEMTDDLPGALALVDRLEDPASRFLKARLLMASGTPEQAVPLLEAVARRDREAGNTASLAADLALLGVARLESGNPSGALEPLLRSSELSQLLFLPERDERTRMARVLARSEGLDETARFHYIDKWRQGDVQSAPCANSNPLPRIGTATP